MSQLQGPSPQISVEYDSTLESVEIVGELVERLAREHGFSEEEAYQIMWASAHVVRGAVVHGNRYNVRKKICVSISAEPGKVTVVVRDEGEGFDLDSVPDPLDDENLLRTSGRGLLIVRSFVDRFRVRNVNPGAEVVMTKLSRNRSSLPNGTAQYS